MGRLLFLLVLLAVSFAVVKYLSKKLRNLREVEQKKKSLDQEKLIQCETCQTYFPQSEAVTKGEKVFCSLKHAQQNSS